MFFMEKGHPELSVNERIDVRARAYADYEPPKPSELAGPEQFIAGFAAWQQRAATSAGAARKLGRYAPAFREALAPHRELILARIERGQCSAAELQMALLDAAPFGVVQPWHHSNRLQASNIFILELLPSVKKARAQVRQVDQALTGYVSSRYGKPQTRQKAYAVAAGDILVGSGLWQRLDIARADPLRDTMVSYFMQLFKNATTGYHGYLKQGADLGNNVWPAITLDVHDKLVAFSEAQVRYKQGTYRVGHFDQPWKRAPGVPAPYEAIDYELLRKYRDIDDELLGKFAAKPNITVAFLKHELSKPVQDIAPKMLALTWALLANKPDMSWSESRELRRLVPQMARHVEPLFTGEQATRIALGEAPIWMLLLAADALRNDRESFWLITDVGANRTEDRGLLTGCLHQAFSMYGFAGCNYRVGTSELVFTAEFLVQEEMLNRLRGARVVGGRRYAESPGRHALLDIAFKRQRDLLKLGDLRNSRSLHWKVRRNLAVVRRRAFPTLGEKVVDLFTGKR